MKHFRKLLVVIISFLFIFISQGFVPQQKDDDKATNLKVLPKDISDEQLHLIMKGFSKSLGVKCGFCHQKIEGGDRPKFDFSSDAKSEKLVAREMMMMTDDINKKYIDRIGEGNFSRISCVTCHMGHEKPLVNVDSLPVKTEMKKDSIPAPPVNGVR